MKTPRSYMSLFNRAEVDFHLSKKLIREYNDDERAYKIELLLNQFKLHGLEHLCPV